LPAALLHPAQVNIASHQEQWAKQKS
jgi:hypothetical protein